MHAWQQQLQLGILNFLYGVFFVCLFVCLFFWGGEVSHIVVVALFDKHSTMLFSFSRRMID